MSVELDWSALDADLTAAVVAFITAAFTTAKRPSYLGEITVTSFSFGDAQPEVTLLDVRDIHKDFLEDDDDEDEQEEQQHEDRRRRGDQRGGGGSRNEREPVQSDRTRQSASGSEDRDRDRRRDSYDRGPYRPPPPPAAATTTTASGRGTPTRRPTLPTHSSSLFSPGLHHSFTPPLTPQMSSPFLFDQARFHSWEERPSYPLTSSAPSTSTSPAAPSLPLPPPPPTSSTSSSPSLQLHLRVNYSGNLHLGLSTSLLINYPSPNFMALPLKLSVTSLAFSGIFMVAFEGASRRIHIALLDPKEDATAAASRTGETPSTMGWTKEGILSAGGRLLSSAIVDSEVGQGEKHVLKNVGKVEKFVLDVMRSTLESELVFP